MSRVAKAPITKPENVEITLGECEITVKGPKGILTQKYNRLVSIVQNKEDSTFEFSPSSADPKGWAHAGTVRALVHNMIIGVTDGFSTTLELVGVGYRAQAKDRSVTLSLGFSHPIDYILPNEVTAESPNNTTIILKSTNKQILGQVASEIRGFRPPEPYKGKGVRYAGEAVVRKEAKKK
jgi:large subunit ribosomal protein L6